MRGEAPLTAERRFRINHGGGYEYNTTERSIETQRFRIYIKKWVIVGLYSLGLSSIKPDKAERREKSCKTQRIVSALRIWLLSLLNESGFVSGSGS